MLRGVLCFSIQAMEGDPHILAIAQALIERFGAEAIVASQERAQTHWRAEESEGAEFWQRIADAVRMILTGHAARFLRPPSA
jgi:hypothetical protein